MDLATAIGNMEGWGKPGTIATRNNNPGNLRYSPLQSGSEQTVNGTFASFSSPEVGWQALQDYIAANSGLSLRDFIYKYAPPTENNTSGYLSYLSGQLGLGVDSPIGDLYGSVVDTVGVGDSSVSDWIDTDSTSAAMIGLGVVVGVILLTR